MDEAIASQERKWLRRRLLVKEADLLNTDNDNDEKSFGESMSCTNTPLWSRVNEKERVMQNSIEHGPSRRKFGLRVHS